MQQRLLPFKEFLRDGFPYCVCYIRNTVRATMTSGLGPAIMHRCVISLQVGMPCLATAESFSVQMPSVLKRTLL